MDREQIQRSPGRELVQLLGSAVPHDDAGQALADRYIDGQVGRAPGRPWRVLDLGCGSGDSIERFRARDPHVQWVGVDLPASPEVQRRTRTDARFETFDGVSLPFPDASFDLVYCKQVLEHVRDPGPLLAEVHRVLAQGGTFAGSTSQLEPFHSLSTWNYTPFGLRELLRAAGLELIEVRPGIDALALIARRLLPRRPLTERVWARWWGRQSPLNRLIDLYGRGAGLTTRDVAAMKLLLCGQFTFLARHPPGPR